MVDNHPRGLNGRRLEEKTIVQIFRLWNETPLSKGAIAKKLGINRKTVCKYLRMTGLA